MAEEIRQANFITDEEKDRLFNWGENIFGVDPHALKWRSKDVHFVLYDDTDPVSHVGLLKHEVSVRGRAVLVAGLGSVVTVPEAQGRGFARKLVGIAAGFFEREWKVEAGLLFCLERLAPYYESLAWRVIQETVWIEQSSGKIKSPFTVMVWPCGGRDWPSGEVDLKSLPW